MTSWDVLCRLEGENGGGGAAQITVGIDMNGCLVVHVCDMGRDQRAWVHLEPAVAAQIGAAIGRVTVPAEPYVVAFPSGAGVRMGMSSKARQLALVRPREDIAPQQHAEEQGDEEDAQDESEEDERVVRLGECPASRRDQQGRLRHCELASGHDGRHMAGCAHRIQFFWGTYEP